MINLKVDFYGRKFTLSIGYILTGESQMHVCEGLVTKP